MTHIDNEMLNARTPSTLARPVKPAFTLVELLVVVGIISVLIALLLPALHAAQASARQISCASQLRQMGALVQMYVSDTKGFIPSGYDLVGNAFHNKELSAWTSNYLGLPNKDENDAAAKIALTPLLKCPEAMVQYSGYAAGQGRSYAFNGQVWYDYLDTVSSWGLSPGAWAAGGTLFKYNQPYVPSQTALLFCSGQWVPNFEYATYIFANAGSPTYMAMFPHHGRTMTTGNYGSSPIWTDGKENVLFFDGHVESLSPDFSGTNLEGVIPTVRPAPPLRRSWNLFWKGVNSTTSG